jgi:hypothetical protein
MTARIILTIGTLIYGVAPLFADLNTSHVFHPEWTPHARFHMVWLLSTNTAIALFSLYLIWRKGQLYLAGFLGLLVLGGFWIAAFTRHYYQGSFSDVDGIDLSLLGLDANAAGFSVALAILVSGMIYHWFRSR